MRQAIGLSRRTRLTRSTRSNGSPRFVTKFCGGGPTSEFFQMDSGQRTSSNAPVGCNKRLYGTGSVLPVGAAGAYKGSGGIRIIGGRSLCIPRRHHYRSRRDTTLGDGSVGAYTPTRARRLPWPRWDTCPGRQISRCWQEWVSASRTREGERWLGSDDVAIESAIGIVRDEGTERLARMLPRMPDEQVANFLATGSMIQRMADVEGVMDPKLPLPACRRVNSGAMWMLENLRELSGTAEEPSFFEESMAENTGTPPTCAG